MGRNRYCVVCKVHYEFSGCSDLMNSMCITNIYIYIYIHVSIAIIIKHVGLCYVEVSTKLKSRILLH